MKNHIRKMPLIHLYRVGTFARMTEIISGLLIILFSCEKEIKIDIPEHVSKVDVIAQFTTDSVWSANVSFSRGILDNVLPKLVDNGLVTIWHAGQPVDTLLSKGYGVYRSKAKKPLPQTEYELKVSVPGYDTLRARSAIPETVPINDVSVVHLDEATSELILNVQFDDTPLKDNFYKLEVATIYSMTDSAGNETDTRRFNGFVHADSEAEENIFYSTNFGLYFRDTFFKDKTGNIRIKVYHSQPGSKYVIILKNLSEDLYQSLTDAYVQQKNYHEIFSQPIKVHTNIQGGFGVFGGFSQSAFEIIVK